MHWIGFSFGDLKGWLQDDHDAALQCFLQSAHRMVEKQYKQKLLNYPVDHLVPIAKQALDCSDSGKQNHKNYARKFFENNFLPCRLSNQAKTGLLTGYYEPVVRASRTRTSSYKYPILRRPDDLVDLRKTNHPTHISDEISFARLVDGYFVECPDRQAIDNGALGALNLEIFWLDNPIDVFFIHIQGSAKLQMNDDSFARISFDGKSGHPYTPIGKTLVQSGQMKLEDVNGQSIRDWLKAHPDHAHSVMATNRSYIFFKEISNLDPQIGPLAAADVPLSAGRSLAIDRNLHSFGMPVWLATQSPLPGESQNLHRLMIAQDTGSAIIGPCRGDYFVGSGAHAEQIANMINQPADFTFLLPKSAGVDQPVI